MATPWSADDDAWLWSQIGHLPRTAGGSLATNTAVKLKVQQIAMHFRRTDGAIKSRLKHLDDPAHSAHKRLHGLAQPPAKRQALSGTISPLKRPGAACQEFAVNVAILGAGAGAGAGADAGPPPVPPLELGQDGLSRSQRATYARALRGENTFITGAAGTGKSYLLRRIIEALGGSSADGGSVAVTASTGVAASHIGGMTLHSWAGIGLGKGDVQKLVTKVMASSTAMGRWRDARALVIDEVSMLDGALFTALDQVGRAARGDSRAAFGGVQLVLCGDFFQLPPVSLGWAGFAFQSPAWAACAMRTCELAEVVLDLVRAICLELSLTHSLMRHH